MAERSIDKALFYTTEASHPVRAHTARVIPITPWRLSGCGTKYCNANARRWQSRPKLTGCPVLRAAFIALSESRSLRAIAERSSFGQRTSSRFVAGTQVADAIRAAEAVNASSAPGVSVDNLGENVTNADEAKASAQLYHHLLDEIAVRKLNANISLKLTHMGLDVDEALARELVRGLVAKAAAMTPRNFVRVDMEGSPHTQRTLDFVHELHRAPG